MVDKKTPNWINKHGSTQKRLLKSTNRAREKSERKKTCVPQSIYKVTIFVEDCVYLRSDSTFLEKRVNTFLVELFEVKLTKQTCYLHTQK